jgi:hypothetical protein
VSFIDRYIDMVDETLTKHGVKPAEIPADYENPRGLPEAWIKRYLSLDRAQLARDVMRAFDQNWKLERRLAAAKLTIWIMSLIVSPFVGECVKLLFTKLFR